MLNLNHILKESLSKNDLDAYYHDYHAKQTHFGFYDTEHEKHLPDEFITLLKRYAEAIGANKRYMLYTFYNDHKELFEFLQKEIKKEYGPRITLYRGLSISAYNKEWRTKKVGNVIRLEATINQLMGWTDDWTIAESFAKGGEDLPAGASRQDAEMGDYGDASADPKDLEDMLGYLLKAEVPYDKIIYAPKLFDKELGKELLSKAEAGGPTAWELQQESEFISLSGIDAKIVAGFVFDNEDAMDWYESGHPYAEWEKYHKGEDDD